VILDHDELVHLLVRATLGGGTDDLVVNLYSNVDPKTKSGTSISIAAGGTGYAVNDVLTFSGGTKATAAQATVTSVSGGVVNGISLLTEGDYTVTPADPIATTVAPAGGSGCTINGDWDGDHWDTVAFDTKTIVTAGAGVQIVSFKIQGYQRFRIGLTGGATDSHSALGWIRKYSKGL
jgi:hypothetical protein